MIHKNGTMASVNWSQVGHKMVESGKGWAQFGFMCGYGERVMGLNQTGAMMFALGLPGLNSVNAAADNEKGHIFSQTAFSLGGFMLTQKAGERVFSRFTLPAAEVVYSKVPGPSWVKAAVAGLVLISGEIAKNVPGILGAKMSESAFEQAYKEGKLSIFGYSVPTGWVKPVVDGPVGKVAAVE